MVDICALAEEVMETGRACAFGTGSYEVGMDRVTGRFLRNVKETS